MRVLVLCITVAMLALGILGCQQAQETAEQAETETEMQMEEGHEGMMEETALVDPVCGMEVTAESEWTAEYEGVTFYFCSEACRDKFVENPGQFLEAMGEEVIGT